MDVMNFEGMNFYIDDIKLGIPNSEFIFSIRFESLFFISRINGFILRNNGARYTIDLPYHWNPDTCDEIKNFELNIRIWEEVEKIIIENFMAQRWVYEFFKYSEDEQ